MHHLIVVAEIIESEVCCPVIDVIKSVNFE
jgi:hypothetical protein